MHLKRYGLWCFKKSRSSGIAVPALVFPFLIKNLYNVGLERPSFLNFRAICPIWWFRSMYVARFIRGSISTNTPFIVIFCSLYSLNSLYVNLNYLFIKFSKIVKSNRYAAEVKTSSRYFWTKEIWQHGGKFYLNELIIFFSLNVNIYRHYVLGLVSNCAAYKCVR